MLKEIFYDNNRMYVAVIENGAFIIVYENGTAVDLQGRKYKLVSHIDENSDLLLSVSNPDESLGDVETQYTYDSFRKLTGISNHDVDYGFTYDNFGRTTAVDVGANFNLTSNFYNSDGTLSSVTYGNNSTASFEYDEDNRVTAEIYDGVKTYEYDYTDEGQLSKLTDNENNIEWNYQYDMAGRLTAAPSSPRSIRHRRRFGDDARHAVLESSHLVKKVKQNREIREFRPKLTVVLTVA